MGRRGLSRRAVGRVLSVAGGAAALAVAGCGGAAPGAQGGAAAGASAAPATLIFWCRDSQENYEKLQAPMVEYRKRNPHITISDENANMSDTEFNTKLRAAFAGGSGPDAWWSATRLLRPLQAMGAVADLTAAYGKARLTADAFYGNSVEELQIDGKLYGVPQGWGIGLLGLNKTLLQRSGVTLAADFDRAWTQAQMVDTLKRVARSDTEGNLGTWGIEWGTGLTTLSPLLWMHGSDLLDKDKKKTVINAQAMAPASVQALQWWTELTWTHRVQPRRSGPDRPQGVNMWNTGRQALNGNAGPNVLSQWTTLDFEWDVVLRPIGPKGRNHRFYSNAYYAGRESKVKDATWDYLSWAGTDGMEFTEAAGGYNIPGYKKIADAIWAPKKSNNVNRSRFLEAARDGKAQPLVVPWDEMNAAVSRAMEELWDQKVNAKVAIEAMQRDIDALLG